MRDSQDTARRGVNDAQVRRSRGSGCVKQSWTTRNRPSDMGVVGENWRCLLLAVVSPLNNGWLPSLKERSASGSLQAASGARREAVGCSDAARQQSLRTARVLANRCDRTRARPRLASPPYFLSFPFLCLSLPRAARSRICQTLSVLGEGTFVRRPSFRIEAGFHNHLLLG